MKLKMGSRHNLEVAAHTDGNVFESLCRRCAPIAGRLGVLVLAGAWTLAAPAAELLKDLALSNSADVYADEFKYDNSPIGSGDRAVAAGGLTYFERPGVRLPTGSNQSLLPYQELWKTDGTSAGTVRLAAIFSGNNQIGTGIEGMAAVSGKLLFFADQPGAGQNFNTYRPWISDGTAAGTVPLSTEEAPIFAGAQGGSLETAVTSNGLLFFGGNRYVDSPWLYRTDGTPAGTFEVKGYCLDTCPKQVNHLTPFGSQLLFWAQTISANAVSGPQIWKSDGTTAGTQLIREFYGNGGRTPLIRSGGKLFFRGLAPEHISTQSGLIDPDLWVTDASTAGTSRLRDFGKGVNSGPFGLTNLGSENLVKLVFAAWSGDGDRATQSLGLWVSNGTAAGTVKLRDFVKIDAPDPASIADGKLFFFADDGVYGRELWVTDGSAGGTRMVADLTADTAGAVQTQQFVPAASVATSDNAYDAYSARYSPRYLNVFAHGGLAYFVLDEPGVGKTLWRSDGSEGGTYRIANPCPSIGCKDFVAGDAGGYFTAVEGTPYLLFAAYDEVAGTELWVTDGTAGGTFRTEDLHVGIGDANPRQISVVNGRVYFVATEPDFGHEMWTAPVSALGQPAGVRMDFGDAPAPYPTLLADDGARHVLLPGIRLGSAADSENDGQPTAAANGDDLTRADDEEGVSFPALVGGTSANLTVRTTAAGVLDAWIDLNRDGDWQDPGERIASGYPLLAGDNTLAVALPLSLNPGPSYARFRVSSGGVAAPTSLAADGEVEDYAVNLSLARISIADASIDEGNSGTSPLAFPVTLSVAISESVTVGYATADGSSDGYSVGATVADDDYADTSGTFTMPAGTTSGSIVVNVKGDTRYESYEAFTVGLFDPVNAEIGDGQATGTIVNDEPPPPSPPLHLKATAGNAKLTLSWSAPSGATGYEVYLATGPGAQDGTLAASVTGTGTILSGLENGVAYYLCVKASNTSGTSACSAEINSTPVPIPDAPQNVTTTRLDTKVSVKWSAVADAERYHVYLGTTANFVSGAPERTVTGTAVTLIELDNEQTYYLRVAAENSYGKGPASSTVVSLPLPPQQPGKLQFSAASYNVDESGGTVAIVVSRVEGSLGAVSLSYTTNNGTATAGSDYTARTGTLSWADGIAAPRSFNVVIKEDTLHEGDESFGVVLSSPTGGAELGTQSSATVLIQDNDADNPTTIQFSAAQYTVGEAGPSVTIIATRSGSTAGAVSVSYTTSNGTATASSDYSARTGTLNWADGNATPKSFNVVIKEDSLYEGDESFGVALSSPTGGAVLGAQTTATVLIQENDPISSGTLALSAAEYSAAENAGSASISVTRSGGSHGAVSVSYAVGGGTTTAGADYTATSGTLSWAAGELGTKTFVVPLLDDTAYEGSETVNLALTNPTGDATLGSLAAAVLTITEDDPQTPGKIAFSAPAYSVGEGGGVLSVTLTRSDGSAGEVSVGYATVSGSATAAKDFGARSGTLTWAAGKSGARSFNVSITDDTLYEGDETFSVNLSGATGGVTLVQNSAGVTIVENDEPSPGTVQFTGTQFSVAENGTNATLTVSRTGGSVGAASVTCDPTGGTATGNTDYGVRSRVLTWASGDAGTKTCSVPITDDAVYEGDETVLLGLSAVSGATLGSPASATLKIVENDANTPGTLQFAAASYTVDESGGVLQAKVTRSGGNLGEVTVNYTTANGTATAGPDYSMRSGTLSWTAGSTATRIIAVPIKEDTVWEGNETLQVLLSDPTGGAVLGTPATATVTIQENDPEPAGTLQFEAAS